MELTAQKEKVTGEKGPVTALEPGTYTLMRSFSYTSHGDRSRSFVPHRSYVPVTGGRYPATLKDLRLKAGTVCGVMVAGLAAPSMLHESASLRWKAASIRISLYVSECL